MENQTFERHALLVEWLHRLMEILRTQGGATWNRLVETVSGKTAVVELDGVQLRLRAEEGEQFQVAGEYPVEQEAVSFRSEAEVLRDTIAGRLTVDAAVVTEKIYLRGNIQDLLGIHEVAMAILADSAINPQLRRLWQEFDRTWARPSALPACLPLERQKPSYGELVRQIPEDVLGIQIDLPEEDISE